MTERERGGREGEGIERERERGDRERGGEGFTKKDSSEFPRHGLERSSSSSSSLMCSMHSTCGVLYTVLAGCARLSQQF